MSLRVRGVAHAGLGVLVALGWGCATVAPGSPELLIRDGLLIDGTGAPARRADVAIRAGRIVAVGDLAARGAARTIDAAGLAVAPGFIDLHSHADLILLADADEQARLLAAKVRQGVTTLIVGNCGLGVAPSDDTSAPILAAINGWMTPGAVRAGPTGVAGYLERLERQGVVVNAGTLVPHGPVRIAAMGLAPGAPSVEQLERMRGEVRAGLRAGAFGLSVGLIYPPGMYSATEELIDLVRPVAAHDRLFTAHVRGSSETLLPATRELIAIARATGARVHHSHLEAVGRRFWPDIERVLALEDAARAEGLRITHDVFPYTRAATMMSAIFPPWALEGGIPALLARLRDEPARARLAREIAEHVPRWPPWVEGGWPHNLVEAVGWDGIVIASTGTVGPDGPVGRSLADLAAERRRAPFDVVADLMLDSQGQVGQLVDEISGQDEEIEPLLGILGHAAAIVVSDAEDYGRGAPHPAHAGAFVRALRLARERNLASLEEMVRRMTSGPAALLGLTDRGTVRPGAAADLVIFDPRAVGDTAGWDDPRRPAAGVSWVLINGNVAVERGRFLGGRHGAVLKAAPEPRFGGIDSVPRGG